MNKKTKGLIALIASVVLCGFPGLIAIIYNGDTVGQTKSSQTGSICLGIFEMAIPVAIYFLFVRSKSTPNTQSQDLSSVQSVQSKITPATLPQMKEAHTKNPLKTETSSDNKSAPLEKAKSLLPKWREAVAQDDASKFDKARSLYLELIRECPGTLSAYNNLAVLDIFEGNNKRAQEYAEKATQYMYLNGQTTLGVVFVRQGRLAEAMKAFKSGGGSKEALTNLCGVCSELGKYDEAISAGEEALKVDPKNPPAYANLIKAYGKAGLQKKAEEIAAIAMRTVNPNSIRQDVMIGRDSMLVVADTENKIVVNIGRDGGLFTISIV
jgi:predicted Zn-dependent protease